MRTDSPLILIVEDNPADFALITEELAAAVDRGVFRLANAESLADSAQLDMTILDIVNNARDAMLGHGAITITSGNLSVPESNPAELPAGDYLMIEITDIGESITASNQKKMFDPFYSTRDSNRLNGSV